MSDTQPPSPSELPDSWKDEDDDAVRASGRSRLLWIIGGIAVIAVIALGVLFVINKGSEERAWPASVDGRPQGLGGEKETAADVTATAAPGVYLWNSFDGWHLWVVNAEGSAALTGTITSSDDIVSAESSDPATGTASLDGKTITFDFAEATALAGVDFDPGFSKKLTIELERDGTEVAATEVFTGAKSAPVDAVPVVIDKPVVD